MDTLHPSKWLPFIRQLQDGYHTLHQATQSSTSTQISGCTDEETSDMLQCPSCARKMQNTAMTLGTAVTK